MTSPQPLKTIDATRFRRTLSHVPTAVTVVTAMSAAGPVGFVVGSFVSISLDPPLVGMFASQNSSSWPHIERSGHFTVNVLAHDQQEVCVRFARSGGDKFTGIPWWTSPNGHPVLPGSVMWIDCRLEETRQIGDHVLAVGRVVDLAEAKPVAPLVFWRGLLQPIRHAG